MDKSTLKEEICKSAHLIGNFRLRSGQISHEYFDKYIFESNPKLLNEISNFLCEMIPNGTEVLAGLEMGGIPIATVISIKSGLSVVFVRKKAKEYGTCKLAEGIEFKGRNVCVIEDVVTTGGQIIESVKELRKTGAIVNTVLCVILRSEEAISLLKAEGLKLKPLFTMNTCNLNAEKLSFYQDCQEKK